MPSSTQMSYWMTWLLGKRLPRGFVVSLAVISCGALALHVRAIAQRRGWDVEVVPLPPELHNRPERIAPAVEELLDRYDRVALR